MTIARKRSPQLQLALVKMMFDMLPPFEVMETLEQKTWWYQQWQRLFAAYVKALEDYEALPIWQRD